MGSRKCYLNFLRKSEPQSTNIVLIHTEMLDVPIKGPTPERRRDVEMVDASTDRAILKEGLWIRGWILVSWNQTPKQP